MYVYKVQMYMYMYVCMYMSYNIIHVGQPTCMKLLGTGELYEHVILSVHVHVHAYWS